MDEFDSAHLREVLTMLWNDRIRVQVTTSTGSKYQGYVRPVVLGMNMLYCRIEYVWGQYSHHLIQGVIIENIRASAGKRGRGGRRHYEEYYARQPYVTTMGELDLGATLARMLSGASFPG